MQYVANMGRALAERRLGIRDPYTLDVTVTIVPALEDGESCQHSVSGRTVNLSDNGICIITHEPLNLAALALCKIAFPFSTANVPTLAQVRWTRDTRREHVGEFIAGLQFLL